MTTQILVSSTWTPRPLARAGAMIANWVLVGGKMQGSDTFWPVGRNHVRQRGGRLAEIMRPSRTMPTMMTTPVCAGPGNTLESEIVERTVGRGGELEVVADVSWPRAQTRGRLRSHFAHDRRSEEEEEEEVEERDIEIMGHTGGRGISPRTARRSTSKTDKPRHCSSRAGPAREHLPTIA